MLKIAGAVLVIFFCSALGYSKSIHMTRRLQQLREIEKMVFLILGEITYRREALPEALGTVAYRLPEPLAGFLKEVSEAAGQYQGACFQEIFREKAKTYLSGTALCPKDLEEFLQLGAYLGYLDITMQKNTITLYLEQLKREMENLQREMPAKQKLYRSMGALGGIFLQGERCHGSEFIIQNRCSRHSGVCPVSDTEAQPEGGAGLSHQSDRSFAGVVLGAALYL